MNSVKFSNPAGTLSESELRALIAGSHAHQSYHNYTGKITIVHCYLAVDYPSAVIALSHKKGTILEKYKLLPFENTKKYQNLLNNIEVMLV